VSILDPVQVAAALDVPADWLFVGYLCIGYPAQEDDTPALARAGWEARRPAAAAILYR
jgi:5,6-dimethylbenzimidazole synthase